MKRVPDAGQLKIFVPRQDEQKSRTANLTIRYAKGMTGNELLTATPLRCVEP
ncbi:MAG: hypothetical protein KME09_00775 [Pleurocapsa minor HA4230-MV1]|jgi:hypothetical protein|nr:hypothetical protein [Pleurocapsa minor HA4230-MV1]